VTHLVVVGVDGAGRTHRLTEIAKAAGAAVLPLAAPLDQPGELAAQLAAGRSQGLLVLVDDAHRLAGDQLAALAAAVRQGAAMVIARRPSLDRPDLAELDEAVAVRGRVELLAPLDLAGVTTLVARVTGRPASPHAAIAILEASAGLPALAAALAAAPAGPPGVPPPALVARVQRQLATAEPATAGLARVLGLRLDLGDEVLAAAGGLPAAGLAAAMRSLRDRGLLVPGGDAMVPAVAQAVLADLAPAERRRVHDAVAAALLATGANPVDAAAHLRAARAWTQAAAQVYRAAGDRLRFLDPGAAVSWFDDAANAGADPTALAAGRAEAAAMLGMPVDTGVAVPPPDALRLALVDGAVAAHHGRTLRSAQALAAAGPVGSVLAVPALMALGRAADADAARAAGAGAARITGPETGLPVPASLLRLAEAAIAVTDPAAALPLFIEAAEAVEAVSPAVVLPDTPHALGALVAVAAGDAATAQHLLDRGLAAGVGGPVAVDRHRLLLAWVRLRTGRYDTAVAELRRLAGAQLPGRERLLLAAVAAGVARRSGDIARLRDAWTGVEQALARGAVDLFGIELVEELAVAAARLRRPARVLPVLDGLRKVVAALGQPAAWAVAVGWIRLQMAVTDDDGPAAAAVAAHLAGVPTTAARQRAQSAAAGCWAAVLSGQVDGDRVAGASGLLADAELPWEASRLAGHAAIRTDDARLARRLLERARELTGAEPPAADGRAEARLGGLSEREVEVARLVLAGATYREIGARLFISAKTVEHHVARVRTKLGATTRAEMVAALREVLHEDGRDR
jgi:DNA-binding CsgD family transcriptional regulator